MPAVHTAQVAVEKKKADDGKEAPSAVSAKVRMLPLVGNDKAAFVAPIASPNREGSLMKSH